MLTLTDQFDDSMCIDDDHDSTSPTTATLNLSLEGNKDENRINLPQTFRTGIDSP